MSFYQNAQSTVLKLLNEFGMVMTIKRESQGTYDPVTGVVSGITQASFNVIGVIADYDLKESGQRNSGETLIQAGDKKITLAAKDLTSPPEVNDQIEVGESTYRVVNIKSVSPAGTPLIYELQGRA